MQFAKIKCGERYAVKARDLGVPDAEYGDIREVKVVEKTQTQREYGPSKRQVVVREADYENDKYGEPVTLDGEKLIGHWSEQEKLVEARRQRKAAAEDLKRRQRAVRLEVAEKLEAAGFQVKWVERKHRNTGELLERYPASFYEEEIEVLVPGFPKT